MTTYHERKENKEDATNMLKMAVVSICILYATKVTKKPCCLLGLLLLSPPVVKIYKNCYKENDTK